MVTEVPYNPTSASWQCMIGCGYGGTSDEPEVQGGKHENKHQHVSGSQQRGWPSLFFSYPKEIASSGLTS